MEPPIDRNLAAKLGPAAAQALGESAALRRVQYRYAGWFVNGRSTANVGAVFEVGAGSARKLMLKHDVADSTQLHRAEFARHQEALDDAPDFAKAHLVAPVGEPVRVGDGSWITFQNIVGGSFTDYRVLSAMLAGVPEAKVDGVDHRLVTPCDRGSFAAVCTAVVRGLLADWAGEPVMEAVAVGEVLRRHLLHRLEPGQPLHAEVQRWPEPRLDLPGELRSLPNPFALVRDPVLTAGRSVPLLTGRAHGDLHPENILVATEREPGDYHLIDLSRYERSAPLTRDPVQLVLTILDRTMDERSDQQRELLLGLLVGDAAADGRDMLPRWLPEFLDQVRAAQLDWIRPKGLVDEWRQQSLLSLSACALMFLGRPTTAPAHREWYLRLAARAAAAYLQDADAAGPVAEPGGVASTADAENRLAAGATRRSAAGPVSVLCANLPALRETAHRRGLGGEVEDLVTRARLGHDIAADHAALVRRLSGADEDVRHGLTGFGGGTPVVGEYFTCPLERPCGREARRPPGGGRPPCPLQGTAMTQALR
ncbi:hypothetical protein ACFFX1_52755 [Dactylosporangium sucinum]|uniref:Uncharacterized protein n=1 Tax=Dactylosporangium sucinum TaxID=1424081 RepID=A0A917UBN5_9ACTN|nr:hypothetical protein [Dactylosporangium sucinum]GGM76374.1 hypothetical protein GCM10007977_092350 [Dactylosporangium sucinum]